MALGSGGDFLLTTVDSVARWAQASSVWPLTMGLACCAIEMMTATAPEYDIARLGSEVFRASPRQADLMIVSGRVARKMGPIVKRLYDQMADPKWVIAMGACASSGGVFDNYAVVQGVVRARLPADARRLALRRHPHPAADQTRRARRDPRPRLIAHAVFTSAAGRGDRPRPHRGTPEHCRRAHHPHHSR
jgi:NADH-quinone oxidoreductase subunit B